MSLINAWQKEEKGNYSRLQDIHKALWSLTTKHNEMKLVWILNRMN